MTPHEFIRKWKGHELSERASAQEHFIDLCRLFDHPTPTEADRRGEAYAFERGVTKTGGGDGFADVWKRGHFAWEYKKRKRSLDLALEQLTRYASALENPPLHVACDTEHFRIVTAWTNTVPKTYTLSLEDLLDADKRAILHAVFHDPAKLRPSKTRASVTAEAADRFWTIVDGLQRRHADGEAVAHFVNQLVFCFFAEDVKLLPEDYFTKLLRAASRRPQDAKAMLDQLFAVMDKGGFHGVESIAHFNGGLFDGRSALELRPDELSLLVALGSMEWDQIDPTIFGTLFERFLDPAKRAQIGAHYTDPDKIMQLVEPVIVRPLLAEWEEVRARIAGLLDGSIKPPKSARTGKRLKPLEAAEAERSRFLDRLRNVRILDPACGSGNFLYLALHAVKDIENRVVLETEALGLANTALLVGPEIVRGLELNPLAAELARTTIWIGYIQWKIANGIYAKDDPILRPLDHIQCRDSLLTIAADGTPSAAVWPDAEFIVGNPPFLGGKLLRSGLGDDYVDTLFSVYAGHVPREADLVTYWFEKARAQIAAGRTKRAGLVCTNSIRGGANRKVLERLMKDAEIFDAWSDEPWIVDGAAVRVSLVSFRALTSDRGAGGATGALTRLNGLPVPAIFADLSAGGVDLTQARRLKENANVVFQGVKFGGPFAISRETAVELILEPLNTNGRPNSDVVRNWINGQDITRRPNTGWCLDFLAYAELGDAVYFEKPFALLDQERNRENEQRAARGERPLRFGEPRSGNAWWLHQRSRPEMRVKVQLAGGCIVTPEVAKHRVFLKFTRLVVPSGSVYVVARDDDTSFGILHSRFHEQWSLRLGTSLEDRPRYTPTTTFETYPFPDGLTPNLSATTYADDPRSQRIAAAARELDEKRRAWLNPPDLVDVVPEIVPTAAPGEEPVKYPDRILPKNADAARKLKERTLTNLYNQRPQWLASLHEELDRAVAAAYGWPEDIANDDAMARLLALNLERAQQGR